MPKLRITGLEREDEAAWDTYVYNSPTSTFYYQQRSILIKLFKSLMWRNVVEKTYKHKPIYLVAKEEGELKGVLPLFLMRSWFFGKKLVSVPFAPYGGVCADNETAERALVEEAKRITEKCLDDKVAIMGIMNKSIKYIIPKYSIDYYNYK